MMDEVTMPAGTTLPKHTHPGDEFIYVLEGSGVLWRKGMEDVTLQPGDVAKIDTGLVHTAITTTEPMKALVFRVHPKGQPERTLAE
jgi:quercetin dioxygenase-like cupin family protein